jgi:hypothetical protein
MIMVALDNAPNPTVCSTSSRRTRCPGPPPTYLATEPCRQLTAAQDVGERAVELCVRLAVRAWQRESWLPLR